MSSSPTPSITVNPVPVATVTVTPSSASLVLGITPTQQLTAVTKDANGNTLTGRLVTWSSNNTAAATVDANGLVTAVAAGSATITATSEGKTGTSAITVSIAPVATVSVSLSPNSITTIQTSQATATLKDANGNTLSGRAVVWSSDNTAIATVSQAGVVTPVAAGTANIIATSEGKTGSAALTVTPAPVATVSVSPTSATLVLGITPTQQLTAVTKDANGNTLTGRVVTWSSNNTAAATVDANGLVTAVAAGSATITATSEGKTGTSSITVNIAPVATVSVSLAPNSITAVGTSQATATTRDANGNLLTGRAVTWSSDNTAVATVDATGLVTAVTVGTANIIATSEGKTGSALLTVTQAPVATINVSLNPTSITAIQTSQATATLLDAKGRTLTGRAVAWSSDNTAVATVSVSTGLVTAVAPGTANIIATSESQNGSAMLTVTQAPVATVTITPSSANLVLGITPTQQLTAVTKDANGNTLTGRVVTWSSDNTAAATVNASGLVTAVAAGSATITASSEGQAGTSAITVSVAPVASVTVSSPTTPMVVGDVQQLTAVTKDAHGNVLTGRTITWSSSNTTVLTVSTPGSSTTVTALAVGSATITATSETITSSPTPSITVNPAPVVSVTLSMPVSMTVGGTQVLTARPVDSHGNTLVGRTVNWVSSNPMVLAVSAASSVSTAGGATVTLTGVAAGTATITATSETAPSATTPTISVSPALATGPLRVSSANPRYFADASGKPVYLTGSEYWKTIQDNGTTNPPPTFDYSGFLDFLTRNNHNFTRLYMWEQARWSSETTIDHWFSPTPYERLTSGDTALDGGFKFDVSKINPAYLARVRQRAIDAGARGIYVSIMLFNGWSVEDKEQAGGRNPWLAHPFNAANNINGIDGDPNGDGSGSETQTLSIPAITALQDTYVKAVIDAVNDLDNVLYEISNESDQSSDSWQYHMIDLIRSYEATKPKQHPIGMSVPYPTVPQGTNQDVLNSSADWVSMNGNADAPSPWAGSKVSLWDTDHLCGICGDAAWPWKSLTRGHNPLLMDGYDGSPGVGDPEYNPDNPIWPAIRTNMGYARSYALRMDLANDTPRGDLASTGYCLAGTDYLVLLPLGGSVSVNLGAVSGTRTVEWFNTSTGETASGGTVTGGTTVNFTSPFGGVMAVLFIHP
ncbi:MAG TPA: Ig-like domain-containing protein [Gemmatimonadaceae bacterium]|nr:Ig-like domain-containing protein [Gemmatimonadaceae bacterium]